MNLVEVFNGTRVALDCEAVALLVARVLEAEEVYDAELSVLFVGERRMRALNREHRGKDEVTDVLSFPLEDADEESASDDGPVGPAAGRAAGSAEVDDRRAYEAADEVEPPAPPRLLGDVVVCARQALRQARADSLPPAFELAVLLAHGTLHLLGYDHEVDAGEMALRQAEVLELVAWEGLVVSA
ncbi:MAG TPA: rRNA maturation RNase YbeY [Thermoleophilia bacterium]|nr:rRNA maturation RNase YbeY [Thermoleophilia bacterium]